MNALPKRPVYEDPCCTYLCGVDVIEKRYQRHIEDVLAHERAISSLAILTLKVAVYMLDHDFTKDEVSSHALNVLGEIDRSGWLPFA